MEKLGLRPGRPWAYLAGLVDGHDQGPLGRPIWVTEGGPELPVLNIAISTALTIREPDMYSLDRILGIRLPAWVGPRGDPARRALRGGPNRRGAALDLTSARPSTLTSENTPSSTCGE